MASTSVFGAAEEGHDEGLLEHALNQLPHLHDEGVGTVVLPSDRIEQAAVFEGFATSLTPAAARSDTDRPVSRAAADSDITMQE